MNPNTKARRRRRGFTLIELLVVITIIAILASMLLPALQQSKEKARLVLELSNRKQVMLATTLYATDFDDRLPDRRTDQSPQTLRQGNNPNLNAIFVEPYIGKGPEIRGRYMFCESSLNTIRGQDGPRPDYSYDHWNHFSNYGTLQYFHMPTGSSKWMIPAFSLQSMSSAEPHRPVWGCMTLRKAGAGWMAHDRPDVLVAPRGGNYVYLDGHGRWVPQVETTEWFSQWGEWFIPMDGL